MFEHNLAARMSLLNTESAFAILSKARALEAQGRSIIHMEIGQPDFPTPRNIKEAAYRALDAGYTGYSPSSGYPEAREAIAEHAAGHKSIKTSPDEVVIVPGGKPVMFYTMLMLLNLGDEVVFPSPAFPIYRSVIRFSGGVPVPIPLLAQNGFRLDLETFRQSLSAKTKVVLLNNPSNPTGGIFTEDDIAAIARILQDYPNIYILSDEIYDRIVFEGGVKSIASIQGMKDRTIILDGFSKTYSMTGWRIGYGIMHRELAKQMELLMVNSNSCCASFTQMAAIEALRGPQDAVETMVAVFRERRDYLVAALNAIPGISCQVPLGAFYAFPDISGFGLSSEAFAERLMNEAGVAALSGASFGEYGEGHIRLSYATALEEIKAAIGRIEEFTRKLR